ncbi:unnamed protein product, partial [Pylaiella littoralis]
MLVNFCVSPSRGNGGVRPPLSELSTAFCRGRTVSKGSVGEGSHGQSHIIRSCKRLDPYCRMVSPIEVCGCWLLVVVFIANTPVCGTVGVAFGRCFAARCRY